MQTSLQTHIQQRIDALHYDFKAFTLEAFLIWIGEKRKRSIQVYDVGFTSQLFGFWCPTESQDYIFVKASLHPTHRIHVVLHEIAHILLNHKGFKLEEVLTPALLSELAHPATNAYLRAPASYPSTAIEEQEAECFVALIQQRLMKLNRLRELYGEGTSIPALKPYAHGFDFTR